MIKLFKIILLLIMTTPALAQNNFKTAQLKFERVRNAYADKWSSLQKNLQSAGYNGPFEIYMAAYKTEGKLEIWLKTANQSQYKLFKTYDFCAHSGTIGPKVIEGDGQTPEGFYKINVFNPMSNFHLSLGLDYPNKVDVARTGKGNKTGGDIYIHGNCVTIGCIPLTDEKIKEVYVLAVEARNAGQGDIPVSIYPFKMTDANMKKYGAQYPLQVAFWQTLQKGYLAFEKDKQLAKVTQVKGSYVVK
ncbi:murein L,D-transpeptidase family protein [Pedobacter frigiditerrae]|uniref:L,D-transpeptidase family protein n=1 Tax=Pedobacter frigiditerrae TaxID=2530452 RepID=UPI00292DB3E4|nr:L,D-transpeptidase family protein [Pedobacter frigiditerrae]